MKKRLGKRMKLLKMVVAVFTLSLVLFAMAAVGYCTPTPPTLEITFDTAQMFTWAQTIINAMMPVVYIIMGVGLGFIVIRAFKSAFN